MVYEGDLDYIFVSYAHKDASTVIPIIEALQARGYRVWFDSGIEAGSEWPENIAEHLDGCACFLAFMSEAASASHNCRREINRAIKLKKNTLVAFIDDVNLSAGMEMQLDILQAIFRKNFSDDAQFFEAIASARILECCLDGEARPSEENAVPKLHKSRPEKVTVSRRGLVLGGIGALAAATGVGALFMRRRDVAKEKAGAAPKASLGESVDDHLILALENANHTYETGLENWRRLDYARAKRDITKALGEIAEQQSQSEIEVAKVNNSLGCLHLDMGNYDDAYDYLNDAYVTMRDVYGEESLAARAVRFSIAEHDFETGDLQTALKELQYIADNSDENTEKSVLVSTGHLQARIDAAQGRYDDALAALDNVLALYDDIVQDGALLSELADYANDPQLSDDEKADYTTAIQWIAQTYANKAEVLSQTGRKEEALATAQTGLDLCLNNVYIGTKNLVTSRLYQRLAVAESALGQTTQALNDIDLAMRIQLNLFDFEGVYPGLVDVYDAYADILATANKNAEAADYYDKAIDLAVSSFGENHPKTAFACSEKAWWLLTGGKADEAADLFERAATIRRNILAESHPEMAQLYLGLATAYDAMGNGSQSKEYADQALDLADRLDLDDAFVDACQALA